MSDRSQMLYLLHAERRILDQVYQRRYRSLGLSWEAALAWVQGDSDRINRLLSLKILQTEGDNLRLSPIVQQFWEQWEGEATKFYSWAEFQADWQVFDNQILTSTQSVDSAQLRHWVGQIQRWQQFLDTWDLEDLEPEHITFSQEVAKHLEQYTSHKLGLDQALDHQLILLLDSLQLFAQNHKQNEIQSDLSNQIVHLQSLRKKDLLFEQTDIEAKILALEANIWQSKASPWLWPSLGAES